MTWYSSDSLASRLFSGDPVAILVAFVVAVSLPLLLHLFLYRASARKPTTPLFALLGTSGAGKTSLLTLLQRRSEPSEETPKPSDTRTTQVSSTVQLLLPSSVPLGSNRYRSRNDTSVIEASKYTTPYLLSDTPGHGKLRVNSALTALNDPNLKGVIFIVDSAALESGSSILRDTAAYLHDVLLHLQGRKKGKSKAKQGNMPFIIAANKQDLFTALPAGSVKERLQTEIENVRHSKSRGVANMQGGSATEEEEDMLGGTGEERFTFKMLEDEEYGINIEVVGGSVRGEEAGKGVGRWEEWIGSCL
ncbi:MAG: hypothetical protein Q9160_007084 [Pyrenula sp. 1 TL-2023]